MKLNVKNRKKEGKYEDGLEDGQEYLEGAKIQSHREGKKEGYKEARLRNEEVEVKKYEEG